MLRIRRATPVPARKNLVSGAQALTGNIDTF
jgi:hypothetical protein